MTQISNHLSQLGQHLGTDALGSSAVVASRASSLRTPLLIGSAVLVGLQAGLYFAFSVGVMPGLRHVDDKAFISTMQEINLSIVNPIFLLTFFGAPVVALAAIFVTSGRARQLVVVGAVCAVLTLLITVAGNIPLNNALADAGPVDQITDLHAVRAHFENAWTVLNALRTVTGVGGLVALAWAAVR